MNQVDNRLDILHFLHEFTAHLIIQHKYKRQIDSVNKNDTVYSFGELLKAELKLSENDQHIVVDISEYIREKLDV